MKMVFGFSSKSSDIEIFFISFSVSAAVQSNWPCNEYGVFKNGKNVNNYAMEM